MRATIWLAAIMVVWVLGVVHAGEHTACLWTFDEEDGAWADDVLGNRAGEVYGAKWTDGRIGGGLRFDGEDDYVALPDNEPVWLPVQDFTISFWVCFERDRGTSVEENEVLVDFNAGSSSDWNDGLRPFTALATIQKAVDVAETGDTVLVRPGVYREEVHFSGKAITVQSAGDAAVIEAAGGFGVSFDRGEGAGTVLRNFVIANSDVGIWLTQSSPTISNVTVVRNVLGVAAYRDSHPCISNSIFWGNAECNLFGCGATYTCSERGDPRAGNFSDDPLFMDPENGDYHVRSRRGRYWPEHDIWVLDKATSPCVDAGDPTADFSREPTPNGGRLNVGAHGGTAYAERSEVSRPRRRGR